MRSRSERAGRALATAIALVTTTARAIAQTPPPTQTDATPPPTPTAAPLAAPAEEPSVDVMHVLAAHGLHDFVNERVNAYGQITLIGDGKAPFAAKYTNVGGSSKSLLPSSEGSWTATTTLYLAGRLWHGGEAYVVPEVISERPFSNLAGLGGAIQNGELQKGGVASPTIYMSRVYLRQTFDLGGDPVERKSAARTLGATVRSTRLVLTLGKFSTIDFMDQNAYAADTRRQFNGLAFMTHAAWDFASDARGYTWGGIAELYAGDFAFRFAHTLVPVNPNDLPMDYRFWKFYGDQLEIEHDHKILSQRGSIHLLGYRNFQNMGRFDDAVSLFARYPTRSAWEANPSLNPGNCPGYTDTPGYEGTYNSTNKHAPDLCWVRKPNQKLGIGVSLDQSIADEIGVFFRFMYSDGQTEVYAYMPADRSLSFGALAKGTWWKRPGDSFGAAFGTSWISLQHATYLAEGGIDGFIGDGRLNQSAESTFETFYSVNVTAPMWLSFDYQHVVHPAYNADRGHVDIGGARLHVEF
jgi:hypothetical protein